MLDTIADAYAHVRELPLLAVLAHLGCGEFRKVKDGWAGKCPVQKSEKNEGCFRFTTAGLWHWFSCDASGKSAIDLVQAVRQIGLRAAVARLTGIAPA